MTSSLVYIRSDLGLRRSPANFRRAVVGSVGQPRLERTFDVAPLGIHDAEHDRVTQESVPAPPVFAEHALADRPQFRDRALRWFVAGVGLELNPARAELFERVTQEQVLGLPIDSGSLGTSAEPRAADFETPVRERDVMKMGDSEPAHGRAFHAISITKWDRRRLASQPLEGA